MGTVVGNYELIDLIGRGGMGEVWRATHRTLGHPVAVKLIRPGALGGGPDADRLLLRRFEREARTAATLRSPHTTRIHDFGTSADGSFYQVMELLHGVDLQVLVTRFGAQPPARVAVLLRQACDALAEAHAQGFVHRDLKPANLFLVRGGASVDFVKVLDFGLTRSAAAAGDTLLTQAGVVPGSPAYLPPELLRGESATDRADVYALGCVAWWLLTGALVFDAPSPIAMIVAHLERSPGALPDAVPADLSAAILSCLAKDPTQRPSAKELSRRLAPFCGGWSEDDGDAWWDAAGPRAFMEPQPAPMPALGEIRPTPQALDRLREQASTSLRRHFEESRIDLGDFERRIRIAQSALTPVAVDVALAGLPPVPPPPAPVAAAPLVPVPPTVPQLPSGSAGAPGVTGLARSSADPPVLAVFSSIERAGVSVDGSGKVIAVFGSAVVDLRSVSFPPGVTELRCVAVFGSVELIVLPGLYVELVGVGVVGSFESKGVDGTRPPAGVPSLRITGAAVLGSVEVICRGPTAPRMKRLTDAGIAAFDEAVEVINAEVERSRRKRIRKDPKGV